MYVSAWQACRTAWLSLPAHRLRSRDAAPRREPVGRQAAFIDPQTTHGVLIEITSEPPIQAENHS